MALLLGKDWGCLAGNVHPTGSGESSWKICEILSCPPRRGASWRSVLTEALKCRLAPELLPQPGMKPGGGTS